MERRGHDDFKAYFVLSRPVKSVLEFLANTEAMIKARNYTIAIKKYLEEKRGEVMQVYTSKFSSPLVLKIPDKHPIIAGCFAVTDAFSYNIPAGETFFAPELVDGNVNGEILMGPGSHYFLTHPVQGKFRFKVEQGKVTDWDNEGGVDEDIERYISRLFEDDANKYIAEVAIGVLGPILKEFGIEIPMEDMRYNKLILEKVYPHIAWGSAIHVEGTHKAPEHIDNSFPDMNVFVGSDHLVINGIPNERILANYMP